eukprot:CAMPEP_0198248832 /NCGR_PEP_ID=MMETSP1447-20131203/504_1 /TAXON_ID=420782 /ORGANISM="Chaetoceros dichaeta, Strain CCMP1751" /LENGTH=225 /DNA_ID=CAMNT_0043933313 /DNA_START=34 /DNA_END=711 /DNA_ORIENTATION=+
MNLQADPQAHLHHSGLGEDGSNSNPFCANMSHMGGGMTMYMDGFHFTLNNPEAPCINLFLPHWSLHTRLRFCIAMAGVLLLGISVETISTLRARYSAKVVKLNEGGRGETSLRVQLVMTLLHGLQALMGYILMLATMTYSIEILFSTVVGLSMGFFISLRYSKTPPSSSNATNPCCDFLEDDAVINESISYERIREDDEEAKEVKPATSIFGSAAGLEKRRNIPT